MDEEIAKENAEKTEHAQSDDIDVITAKADAVIAFYT